jgi:hypothetical protein
VRLPGCGANFVKSKIQNANYPMKESFLQTLPPVKNEAHVRRPHSEDRLQVGSFFCDQEAG